MAGRVLPHVVKAFQGLLVKNVDEELRRDIALVESLQLTPEQHESYLPSRFDRPSREAATRIERLYFQNTKPPLHQVILIKERAQ